MCRRFTLVLALILILLPGAALADNGFGVFPEQTETDSPAVQTILSFLSCEYTLVNYEEASEKDLIAWYRAARKERPDTTPVIIVAERILAEGIAYWQERSLTAQDMIARAELIYKERYPNEEDVLHEPLPAFEELPYFLLISELSLQDGGAFILALLPTQNPWEAACYVAMGGFNDCLLPEEQAASFRHWYNACGATPVAIDYSRIYLQYRKTPPRDPGLVDMAQGVIDMCPEYGWEYNAKTLALALAQDTMLVLWWD